MLDRRVQVQGEISTAVLQVCRHAPLLSLLGGRPGGGLGGTGASSHDVVVVRGLLGFVGPNRFTMAGCRVRSHDWAPPAGLSNLIHARN